MKKIILCCSMLLLVAIQLIAQSHDKAIDYFIYKIAEGSLKATTTGAVKEKQFYTTFQQGEDYPPTFEEIQKEFGEKGKIKAPKTLEMLESLHKLLKANQNNLTILYLSETIFEKETYKKFDKNNSFQFLADAINGKSNNTDFNAKIWKDSLNSTLAKYFPKVQKKNQEELVIGNETTPQYQPPRPARKGNNNWLFILPLLTLLVGFTLGWVAQIFVAKNKANQYRGLEEQIKNLTAHASNLRTENQKEVHRLKEKITGLENEISQLRVTAFSSLAEREAPQAEYAQSQNPNKNLYYFPSPDSQGRFPASWGRPHYDESSSIYELTVQGASIEATFRIAPHNLAHRLALSQFESMVKPVCNEPDNLRQPNTKRIQTEVPGRAQLKDGYWIVTQKAKIRYE